MCFIANEKFHVFFKENIFLTFNLCNFLAQTRMLQCFFNKFKLFFAPENMKKQLSKVAHNRRIFFSLLPTDPKPAQILGIFHKNFPPRDLTMTLFLPLKLLQHSWIICLNKFKNRKNKVEDKAFKIVTRQALKNAIYCQLKSYLLLPSQNLLKSQ